MNHEMPTVLGRLNRFSIIAMKTMSFVALVFLLIANDAKGFEAGAQLYPDQKRGLEFEIVGEYWKSTETYAISVLVDKKGKLRKLDKLQLTIVDDQEATVLHVDDLNISRLKGKLTINGKQFESFTGARFRLNSQYLDGARLRLVLPGFVYIVRLKDFVHATGHNKPRIPPREVTAQGQ